MIASWWGSADDVLHHAQRARTVGLSGVGAIRLAGFEARALAQRGQHQQGVELLRTAQAQRDELSTVDSLRDLGEVFTFSAARQHHHNAAACAYMCDWDAVEREASRAISLYGTPETGQCWPVTMTVSQVHLAQARLGLSGPRGSAGCTRPCLRRTGRAAYSPNSPRTKQNPGAATLESVRKPTRRARPRRGHPQLSPRC